jgi:hypothetical protein
MKTRYNDFEEQVNVIIKSFLDNKVQTYEECNTLKMVELKRKYNDKNKIFYDVESPYLTNNNNPRKTEFVIDAPQYKIYWRVECKSQKEYSNLVCRLYDELDYITDLPEDRICFIVEGALSNPIVLKKFTDKLKTLKLRNKVWIGTVSQFENELIKKRISA